MTRFPADLVGRLREAEEVRIESAREPEHPPHRTTIWVMVDDQDRVLVRSVRGERGRWYRDLRANPDCALILKRERIEARAELADDDERVEATNRALQAKYEGIPGFEPMLRPNVLHTNFELHPR